MSKSLPEVHGSVAVPHGAGFFRKMLAFAGPGYLVAVGYMDPGNWATSLAGGSKFGYALLTVALLSNLMAILSQALLARQKVAQVVARVSTRTVAIWKQRPDIFALRQVHEGSGHCTLLRG